MFESNPEITKKQLSIKDFVLSKKPKDEVQKTLTIAYYLENYREMKSFNIRDLKEGFIEAKENVRVNINDKINHNIKSGFMAEAKEKKDGLKAWYILNKGEKFVENDFQEE